MTNNISTVFIPNWSPTNNYNDVRSHGEPVYMTKGVVMDTPAQLHSKFARFFEIADEQDHLMLSGSHLVCSIAYAEWVRRFPNARNILMFERHKEIYNPVTITG